MFGAAGDDYSRAVLQRILFPIEYRFAFAFFDADKLIQLMHFFTDVFARLNSHDDKLAIACRVQNSSKVGIFSRDCFDVSDKSFYNNNSIIMQ